MSDETDLRSDGLNNEAREANRDRLRRLALESAAERINDLVADGQVTVYLTHMGKVWEVESCTINGPALQINVDDSLEPVAVMIKK